MPVAERRLAARTLLLIALLSISFHAVWSVRTPVPPNSDRYDYLAHGEQWLSGHGLHPLLEYPLRFAFGGIEQLPGEAVVRPPMWSMLLVPVLQLGGGTHAGVILAALLAGCIAWISYRLASARFGEIAGGVAALGFALSFATRRGIWGGGPELALALVLLVLWGWRPLTMGVRAHIAAASLYGVLPLLHPTGWLWTVLAMLARPGRYAARCLPWMLLVGMAVAAPWYLRNSLVYEVGGGSLPAQAELAKSLDDPGGLGPYRGVTPQSSLTTLRRAPKAVLRTALARSMDRLLHLDALLAWPLVALALLGTRVDPGLALRDGLLAACAVCALAAFSPEARLLLPLLPLATIWAGAGANALSERGVPWWCWPLVAGAAWLLPLGASLRPGQELEVGHSRQLEPSATFVAAVVDATRQQSYFSDSAALSYRVGRSSVFLPDTPQTLQWLRAQPAIAGISLVALSGGSRWLQLPAGAWNPWLAAAETLHAGADGSLLLRFPDRLCAVRKVGPGSELRADELPDDLVELPDSIATRAGIRLRAECWARLSELLRAAQADSIRLRVVSGYRSYEYQAQLFADAKDRHGPQQAWVAAPGQSEHQLGDAADLADAALEHVLEPSFGETAEGRWLRANAHRFDFRISYTAETEASTGIRAEPWHVRYVGGDRCQPQF